METEKQLDPTNIKILTAMWRHGPRNLLAISRRIGLPFTSVYHRVAKLEEKTGRVAYLMPETAKLGLVRVVVLMAASPGCEEIVTEALQLPNLWRFINPCEGAYSHISAHAVPRRYLKDFNRYLRKLVELHLITEFKTIQTGDSRPNFPNFRYYNPTAKRWSFEWIRWATVIKKLPPDKVIEDPPEYKGLLDKKDLLIVKELEKNARRPLADLAPMLKMSLTAVKYRYDKLCEAGVIQHYALDVHAFPAEISAYHEIMLEFTSSRNMNRFYSFLNELPFVLVVAKVLQRNALLVRTYIPETQLGNMFTFLSNLAKAGVLTSYSPIRLNLAGRMTQTISYELYDDGSGWMLNIRNNISALTKLAGKHRVMMSEAKSLTRMRART
jgi:DNA-binding Lrp family transcriptional regulator